MRWTGTGRGENGWDEQQERTWLAFVVVFVAALAVFSFKRRDWLIVISCFTSWSLLLGYHLSSLTGLYPASSQLLTVCAACPPDLLSPGPSLTCHPCWERRQQVTAALMLPDWTETTDPLHLRMSCNRLHELLLLPRMVPMIVLTWYTLNTAAAGAAVVVVCYPRKSGQTCNPVSILINCWKMLSFLSKGRHLNHKMEDDGVERMCIWCISLLGTQRSQSLMMHQACADWDTRCKTFMDRYKRRRVHPCTFVMGSFAAHICSVSFFFFFFFVLFWSKVP